MKEKGKKDNVIKNGSLALFTGREDSILYFSEKLDSLLVGEKEKTNECLSNYYISLMEREDIVIDTEMVLEFAKYSSDKEKEDVFLDKVLPLLQNLESERRYREMEMILNSFESSLMNCADIKTKRKYLEKQYSASYNTNSFEKAISTADSLLMIADNYDYKYKSWVYSIKGDAEGSAGRYRDELNSRENALEILKQVLPENHPDTLSALNNLAACLNNLGKYDEALEKHERCYEISKQVLSENHPDTLDFLNNLADCLYNLGKYEEALEKYKRCYEMRKQILTENHPDTLSSLYDIAACLNNLG
ncbi:MAG: tetratricopeptide repeat protein, partial [Spirochaetales bacterium]|nr:tetratricopeptide repeat protein [Spirochaetales bacterium]